MDRACRPYTVYVMPDDVERFDCCCRCGWTGPTRDTPIETEADGVVHEALMGLGVTDGSWVAEWVKRGDPSD